jgi:hypothetical protein
LQRHVRSQRTSITSNAPTSRIYDEAAKEEEEQKKPNREHFSLTTDEHKDY